ncbi:hypothetical protein EDB19DRAFT_1644419 [Suillus lakei]|nr:hypothetical protein EDB19DRAFT_1644419 [Suillus lakei]
MQKLALEVQSLAPKVLKILDAISEQGITLSLFLDALSWGDESCHSNDRIRFARTGLMLSEELPGILERWYRPPRNQHKGRRPLGAHQNLQKFAVKCMADLLEYEIEHIAPLFASPPDELSQAHLTSFNFEDFIKKVSAGAPVLWDVLECLVFSAKQRARNTHKSPAMVILHLISQAQYTRSHRRGHVTKLWAIYLKACGLSARAFDALHGLGIVMSHKWAANAYGSLSSHAMEEVREDIQRLPWIISHNNVNIPMRVFSQRLHNKSHFTSGCAATVWVLPADAMLPAAASDCLQSCRAENGQTRFALDEVLDGDLLAAACIKNQYIYHVLSIVLNSPEFFDYAFHDDDLFKPPQPVHLLPSGPKNIVKQYILHTVDIEEASYEGNDKVMAEWFRQLGMDSEDAKRHIGTGKVILWIGDQMTVERLRGLYKYRHEDFNAFDRMDYLIPVFGWFHLQMAFANSLHKQYIGTSASTGSLQQAFNLLQRKGLHKSETKGPFWHHLHEALHHISEAHIQASWLAVGGVKSLSELKSKSPTEILTLATTLVDEHASRRAIAKLNHLDEKDRDAVLTQWTMFNVDILSYIELTTAMKMGDIRRMEDLLPTLLFRFAGGRNSKYTIEILELLQGLKQEWPADINRNHVRQHCWLINRSGRPDGWTPIDKGQEQNIGDIKVTYHSFGPGATWTYLHKISPAIPTLRALQRHMESEFKTITRGTYHGIPDKEADITKLTDQYIKSNLHVYEPGRQIKATARNKAEDFVTMGAIDIEHLGTFDNWWRNRAYKRSTDEEWDDIGRG